MRVCRKEGSKNLKACEEWAPLKKETSELEGVRGNTWTELFSVGERRERISKSSGAGFKTIDGSAKWAIARGVRSDSERGRERNGIIGVEKKVGTCRGNA